MKQLAATALSMSLAASAPAFAEEKKHALASPTVTMEDVLAVFACTCKVHAGRCSRRPLEASRFVDARPQHYHYGGTDHQEPARRDANLFQSGARQWSQACRTLGDHHASRLYSGWANATGAVAVAKDVFAARGIGADQLPEASPTPVPLDDAADAQRAAGVEQNVGLAGCRMETEAAVVEPAVEVRGPAPCFAATLSVLGIRFRTRQPD